MVPKEGLTPHPSEPPKGQSVVPLKNRLEVYPDLPHTHLRLVVGTKEYRCGCGALLFKAALTKARIEIRCKRCGRDQVIG